MTYEAHIAAAAVLYGSESRESEFQRARREIFRYYLEHGCPSHQKLAREALAQMADAPVHQGAGD